MVPKSIVAYDITYNNVYDIAYDNVFDVVSNVISDIISEVVSNVGIFNRPLDGDTWWCKKWGKNHGANANHVNVPPYAGVIDNSHGNYI